MGRNARLAQEETNTKERGTHEGRDTTEGLNKEKQRVKRKKQGTEQYK